MKGIDLAQRLIGRLIKFWPLDGCMVSKDEEQINSEAEIEEDELTMRELKKVADSLMENIETEYDCTSVNPELGKKVAVLDLAMWVEESYVSAPWMDSQGLHSNCDENETCLPLGIQPSKRTERDTHVSKMVQQIQFEFFLKTDGPLKGYFGVLCPALGAEENNSYTRVNQAPT